MALYKNEAILRRIDDAQFDVTHKPDSAATYAGIYRCTKCGHEIAVAAGHILPSQAHPLHSTSLGKIEWQLIVYAKHNSAPKAQQPEESPQ